MCSQLKKNMIRLNGQEYRILLTVLPTVEVVLVWSSLVKNNRIVKEVTFSQIRVFYRFAQQSPLYKRLGIGIRSEDFLVERRSRIHHLLVLHLPFN